MVEPASRPFVRAAKPTYPQYSLVTVEDVARLAEALPEVSVGTTQRGDMQAWIVGGKVFAWVRPFSKADIKRFGAATPPDGPIVAIRVSDLAEKEAMLATASPAFFTIPHFNGYAAVLIQLNAVSEDEMREALEDAWFACAPPQLAATRRGS